METIRKRRPNSGWVGSVTSTSSGSPGGFWKGASCWQVVARLDVPFQNPSRPVRTQEHFVTMLQGVRTAAFQTESVGAAIRQGFFDGVQAEQVKSLHGPVGHRGNAQRTFLAVALGNVHPAERL